jgi:hypothetical protein
MEQRSPWITIWTHPRQAIAGVVRENPNRALWGLAWIFGFCALMNVFQSLMAGATFNLAAIVIAAVVVAPFWGWINFSVWSFFATWVGKLFRGQGTFTTVRAAYAWSCVPLIINIPLWILVIGLFGHQVFNNFEQTAVMSTGMALLLLAILVVKVVLAIWSLVLYLNTLAVVHQFSMVRSILTVIVTAIVLGVVVCVLWMLFMYAMGSIAMIAPNLISQF